MTITTAQPYRRIESGHGACSICNEVFALTNRHGQPSFVNRYGVRQKAYLLPIHGPRDNRCNGGHQKPKPWLEASGLPSWDEMTDVDKGSALMFAWKVHWERDRMYAKENYPARYVNHPLLVALDTNEACRHATAVAGTWGEAQDRWGADEVQRLYDVALTAERQS